MAIDRDHCFTSSMDGTIRVWDVHARTSVGKTFSLEGPVLRLQVSKSSIYAVLKQKDQPYSIVVVDRQTQVFHADSCVDFWIHFERLNISQKVTILAKVSKAVSSLTLKSCGTVLAVTSGRRLLIWSNCRGAPIERKHTQILLGSCFHPVDNYLCTSDVTGRIVLWYGYQSNQVQGWLTVRRPLCDVSLFR